MQLPAALAVSLLASQSVVQARTYSYSTLFNGLYWDGSQTQANVEDDHFQPESVWESVTESPAASHWMSFKGPSLAHNFSKDAESSTDYRFGIFTKSDVEPHGNASDSLSPFSATIVKMARDENSTVNSDWRVCVNLFMLDTKRGRQWSNQSDTTELISQDCIDHLTGNAKSLFGQKIANRCGWAWGPEVIDPDGPAQGIVDDTIDACKGFIQTAEHVEYVTNVPGPWLEADDAIIWRGNNTCLPDYIFTESKCHVDHHATSDSAETPFMMVVTFGSNSTDDSVVHSTQAVVMKAAGPDFEGVAHALKQSWSMTALFALMAGAFLLF